ncbi:HTH-type transcriptional regulator TauR [Burkholderia multivorans]|nr:HTH-type transcriptional regulator TauR [Burkholderia multivorans]MDR8924098.1 HTH-type transcriptional regulator TauR [Burkholderia multivorans]MDR8969510.1 HTH-type transcriptional regulator TauR [Burkholderia multivorans]MDR8992690.1 HTH-type transcriptional regulator TauR [Burkholderia multivorans]MDR9023453.1 HTH-type transcriptional regulator TauR [Burkholderia multivorans]
MRAVLLTDLLARALSDGGSDTLQHRIYDVVRRGVLDHTLAAGQKLPSSRTLAQELGISRITVSLAYDRLIAENYLVARTGSGTFVAPTSPRPLSGPGEIVHTRHSMTLSQRGAMLDRLPGGVTQSYGPFVPGVADTPMFPFHVWRRLIARHIGKGDLSLSGYALDGGYAPLRAAVARYLKISRSVVCEPEQVIITSGTHQSIDLCARLLADPGDVAIVENPCHWAFPTVLSAAGLELVASAIDAAGLSLNDIDTPARAAGRDEPVAPVSDRRRDAAVAPARTAAERTHAEPVGDGRRLRQRIPLRRHAAAVASRTRQRRARDLRRHVQQGDVSGRAHRLSGRARASGRHVREGLREAVPPRPAAHPGRARRLHRRRPLRAARAADADRIRAASAVAARRAACGIRQLDPAVGRARGTASVRELRCGRVDACADRRRARTV